ncbi:galactose mutarotase [Flavobacterium sp. ZT3R18]|uniref:aldose epimerase family protein n=1 Tax=Flavobacterium sp. ZT3R18 TaxID=2594429 RepID=UPI00117B37AE|nr:aldose epimerase family protein [Flavobacterium sp. ZT3R18]TRX33514.1 galactose mutarotase [Flavobacterium sp. ZT3R18]
MEIKKIPHFIMDFASELFGIMPNGAAVYSCVLINRNGMQLKVINYGATITSLKIPLDKDKIVDVVLGFDNLEGYLKSFDLESAPYLGATIGRFAGRINNGTFELNGKIFGLNINNNIHSLHGGNLGFSKVVWDIKSINHGDNPSITLVYSSQNNDENYPGDLSVELTYTLSEENELIIEYHATSTEDTIVNLTHHSYFNLDGHYSDVSNLEMSINSKEILETTNENIPTGKFLDVANSSFDFLSFKKCPAKIDTTFILNKDKKLAASLFSEKNKVKMSVYTDQPAVHIYVGGNCEAIKGKENMLYHSLSGICFETQNFPDAPNHKHFPSSVLKKNAIYGQKTIYKFEIF